MHRDIVARHLNGATDEFTDPFIFFGDSIQPRSYLFYPEPLMSRAPRAWWLCTGVVRFDSVPAPAPPPILSAKGGQACTSISRGFLKIEWAAGLRSECMKLRRTLRAVLERSEQKSRKVYCSCKEVANGSLLPI